MLMLVMVDDDAFGQTKYVTFKNKLGGNDDVAALREWRSPSTVTLWVLARPNSALRPLSRRLRQRSKVTFRRLHYRQSTTFCNSHPPLKPGSRDP